MSWSHYHLGCALFSNNSTIIPYISPRPALSHTFFCPGLSDLLLDVRFVRFALAAHQTEAAWKPTHTEKVFCMKIHPDQKNSTFFCIASKANWGQQQHQNDPFNIHYLQTSLALKHKSETAVFDIQQMNPLKVSSQREKHVRHASYVYDTQYKWQKPSNQNRLTLR